VSKINEIESLKDRLSAFNPESPGFDELFKDEVLGETALRNAIQAKLNSFETEAPSYEQLIGTGRFIIFPLSRKKMIPFWSFAAAAAACIAFFLFLPDLTEMNQEGIGMVKEEPGYATFQKHIKHITHPQSTFFTQKLETPVSIRKIPVSNSKINNISTSDTESKSSADSADLIKINSTKYTSLSADNDYSMEEIYAQARERKKNEKHEKIKAGVNINGANRLLAFVNTKQSGELPIQTSLDNYSKGLSALAGDESATTSTSNTILRSSSSSSSTTASKNEWKKPTNIQSSTSLSSFNASYSLPVNVGLSVSIPIFNLIEIQTGLSYTYLSGTISGTTGSAKFNLHQELHYLGIPVRIAINLHEQKRFGLYASFGGSIEKGLIGKQTSVVEGERDWSSTQKIYGIQPVIGGQLGVSYEIAPKFLLYVEPGANYYIASDQPTSSRTEEPFNFNLGFGIRYRFE
jgi:hypothetical protein